MMRWMAVAVVAAVAILGAALLGVGCGGVVVGSGHLVTKGYDLEGFTRLDVSDSFEVEVTCSDPQSVELTLDDNLVDEVDVRVEGETLSIDLKGTTAYERTTQRAKITLPELAEVVLSGASKASVQGFSSSGDLELVLSGASSLVLTDVAAGDAKLDVSGASKVNGAVGVGDVQMDVSGASTVDLAGSGAEASLEASGASSLQLGDLALESAGVHLSGSSTATLDVAGTLDADLSGASILRLRGSPSLREIETAGSSEIRSVGE